jgi:hypothetical protein
MGGFLIFLKRNKTVVVVVVGLCLAMYYGKGLFPMLLTLAASSAVLYGWYRMFG